MMKTLENLGLKHSFFELGPEFFQAKLPDPVSDPYLIDGNPDVAEMIGLDPAEIEKKDFIDYFSGNRPLPGAQPLAMVYSGHQFGAYNPQLGDGRGVLLGEMENSQGQTWDIYIKGCGPTKFARGFDGRATLRSSIREYLAGEAVYGLGISTTRSLGFIGIGELIHREIPEPAALLIRVSDSHIRLGSFEYFHYSNRPDQVTQLADYVIHRHFPEIENESEKYRLLFRSIVERTAKLVASWQSVGFIHGVMNTDNMTVTGTTFDYGPYGFMDRFNPEFTPNNSDHHGRYALGRQPEIGHWNLFKMGETLVHLVAPEVLKQELEKYQPAYNGHYRQLIGQKLGLDILDSEFTVLVGKLFQLLGDNPKDYTVFFRQLADFPDRSTEALKRGFVNSRDLGDWLSLYRKLIDREGRDPSERKENMDQVNPRFILRNYLLQRAVEKALKESDFTEIERLRVLLVNPFKDRPEIFERYGIDAEFYASETPESFLEMQLSCSA